MSLNINKILKEYNWGLSGSFGRAPVRRAGDQGSNPGPDESILSLNYHLWPTDDQSENQIFIINKYISVAYSSQGSHTGQLDFCNWLADGSTMG